MSFNIQDLDTVDNNNQQNWPEGSMKVQDVNDAGRADEGMLARWFADWNGSKITAGLATAYTVSSDTAPTAYYDGFTIVAEIHLENTGAATLNVDSLGATSIVKNGGAALEAGDLPAGAIATFVYRGTEFNVTTTASVSVGTEEGDVAALNANRTFAAEQQGIIGEIREFSQDTPPNTWLECDGSTIGNTGSGATHEGAGYETLFNILNVNGRWGNDGTAVWASGGTVLLPDRRGRASIGRGNLDGSGTNFPLGQKTGAETVTLTIDQIPSHDHPQGLGDNNITAPHGTEGTQANRYQTTPQAGTNEWLTADRGGGLPHTNVGPVIAELICIKAGYASG